MSPNLLKIQTLKGMKKNKNKKIKQHYFYISNIFFPLQFVKKHLLTIAMSFPTYLAKYFIQTATFFFLIFNLTF